ncbi:hypothetical protein QO190_05940 [Cloacibacterium sp. Arc13]|uniref:hypothetical protein n=1 Tax=Cloacibacterium TaxID=501783 RepID=UPI001BCCEAE4|nr:hypothetical protein [Cloacibacterium caeni]
MKNVPLIFLIFFSNLIFCQVIEENKDMDMYLKDVISRDDVYQNDIDIRIKYINDFDKNILINYQNLPEEFIKKQTKENLEIIKQIHDLYYEKVSKMEKEFNYNQKFTYKQLTPKSRINSLLLIDELKNYPDSYSILYSDVLVRFNDKDFEKKMDKLFNLSKNYSVEISKLRLEIDDFKRQFLNKPMYYPIWEKQEVVSYCSYIDIVLWCYSNSSLNKSLSK